METNQQNQDEIEIDLLELLRVLCSKIGYVILAALALGLLMVLVSKVLMKPQYESTTKMYVLSKQDSSNTVTSGDLQASLPSDQGLCGADPEPSGGGNRHCTAESGSYV